MSVLGSRNQQWCSAYVAHFGGKPSRKQFLHAVNIVAPDGLEEISFRLLGSFKLGRMSERQITSNENQKQDDGRQTVQAKHTFFVRPCCQRRTDAPPRKPKE